MRPKRLAVAAATFTTVALGMALTATASAAKTVPSNCYKTDICLYYDGNGAGAIWKTNLQGYWHWGDLAGQHFSATGDGHGQAVKNNAASAAVPNALTGGKVFYNEHCSGPYDRVPAATLINLVQTWNDEASWRLDADPNPGDC